ncbi:MAG: MATE family efflux transporter [Sarcina sp.]
MKNKILNFISDKKFYKTLLILAFPIMIQNILMSSLSMIDTMMVGALGDIPVAAVGIGNQVNFLVQLFMLGIVGGTSIFISQFWGKKDKQNIKRTVGVSTLSSCIVGIVGTIIVLIFSKYIAGIFSKDQLVIQNVVSYLRIMAFSYVINAITVSLAFSLRSIEDSKSPMIVSAIAVLTNITLNYILIFGKFGAPQLGVVGAGIATVIARYIECGLLIYIASKNPVFKGDIKEFKDFDFTFIKEIYRSVIPVLLNEICWGIGNFLYSVAYGQIGTTAMASIQICNNIQNIFMVFGFSMASASLVMVGNQVGAGDEKRAKEYGNKFTILSVLIGIIMGSIMMLSSSFIMQIFNVSIEVKKYSALILNVFAFLAPIRMLNLVVIVGVLRGGGDAGYALKAEAIPMWLIGVPMAFLGAVFLGLEVHIVMILVSIEEIVKFAFCAVRLKNGKWIKSLINNIDSENELVALNK